MNIVFNYGCSFCKTGLEYIYKSEEKVFNKVLSIEDKDRRARFIRIFDKWATLYRKVHPSNIECLKFCSADISPQNKDSDEYMFWVKSRGRMRDTIKKEIARKSQLEKDKQERLKKALEEKHSTPMSQIRHAKDYDFKYIPVNILEI